MGLNTLNNRSAGQTITDTFFNDIHQAMNADFVGRNASGVPSSGQNLGTVALPWGAAYISNLILNGSPIDASLLTSPPNRVISGKKRTTSNQPAFITPSGSGATATIAATATNLVLNINGSGVSVISDIALSGLTLAPSTNNTATVNDTEAAGQDDTRRWGEFDHKKKITISAAGSNITALVGKYAAFKIGTEYFIAFVESTTVLSRAYRGFFYSSGLTPFNRTTFSNGATITLMSLGWVFIENNATTANVTYTNPIWDFTAPTSPAGGDYWYDLANGVWKRYDGVSWVVINRTLVGNVVLDSTNCVAARCVDFYAKYEAKNTVEIEIESTAIVRMAKADSVVNVAGKDFYFGKVPSRWNITTNLAGSSDMYNATEQASTYYFIYVKDTGEEIISDIAPYVRPDLMGKYHPHNPWRCVGRFFNDASSNITRISGYYNPTNERLRVLTSNGTGSTNTRILRFTTIVENTMANIEYADSATLGATFTALEEGDYEFLCRGATGAIDYFGLTKNSTQLSTDIGSVNEADIAGFTANPAASTAASFSVNLHLKAGDVIRYHRGGTVLSTTGFLVGLHCRQMQSAGI